MNRRSLRLAIIVALTAMGLSLPGCSMDATKLPIPGAYLPKDPYRVKIEFSSVLSLPGRARVDSGGMQIGMLDHIELVKNMPVAYVDLDNGVTLPRNIRAELRQATVLGDIYIAMIPPGQPAAEPLRGGDTIPITSTTPSTNIEDLLRSMSNLINGGSLNTLQETVNNINKSIPPPDELMQIHDRLTAMLHDLYANKNTLDQIFNSVDSITKTLKANTGSYLRLLHEGGQKFSSLAAVAYSTADLIIQAGELGRITSPLLNPIAPDTIQMLSYITPAIQTASTLDTTVPVTMNKLVRLLRERIIPFFKDGGPKYTVTDITNPDGGSFGAHPGERADEVIQQMQTMGLIR